MWLPIPSSVIAKLAATQERGLASNFHKHFRLEYTVSRSETGWRDEDLGSAYTHDLLFDLRAK